MYYGQIYLGDCAVAGRLFWQHSGACYTDTVSDM